MASGSSAPTIKAGNPRSTDLSSAPARQTAEETAALGFRPLYRQVKERLVRRIAEGQWQPGQILPSEAQIAAEFGVSQGTVRKALDEMTADNMLVRRQGRGTFVARHDEQRILFQFFKLVPDTGEREFPESVVIATEEADANEAERERLSLPEGARVLRIRRVRLIAGRAAISEYITLPSALFPGLAGREIPNNLYGLYASQYGVTVIRAAEKIKAVGAEVGDAAALGVPAGTPVLLIDRLAEAIDGTPAEWRVSICRTDHVHYLSDLR